MGAYSVSDCRVSSESTPDTRTRLSRSSRRRDWKTCLFSTLTIPIAVCTRVHPKGAYHTYSKDTSHATCGKRTASAHDREIYRSGGAQHTGARARSERTDGHRALKRVLTSVNLLESNKFRWIEIRSGGTNSRIGGGLHVECYSHSHDPMCCVENSLISLYLSKTLGAARAGGGRPAVGLRPAKTLRAYTTFGFRIHLNLRKHVSMISSVSGEGLLRRVKQEAESQYSPPPAAPTLQAPAHHSAHALMQPEMDLEPKEEIKYCVSPPSGSCDTLGGASPEQQHCSSTTAAAAAGAKDDDAPRRLCLVCGDIASGFHYGVASCEACKAFFKRTIQRQTNGPRHVGHRTLATNLFSNGLTISLQGNIEYTCPASNECEINKRRRKACQACRFRKCLRTGMLREGVRLDRVRGGRQKYRRAAEAPQQQMQQHQPQPKPHLDDIKILEALSSYEPDLLQCAPPPPGVTEAGARTLAALADLYDRELVGVIGWAKQIPGFTDLQLNDQMRLLHCTWAEMLSLMVAYRSMSCSAPTAALRLRFAADLTLDEQQARDIGAHDLYLQVAGVARRLERASALREECYLLKALALANSEARLDEHAALRRFREAILAALNDAVNVLRPYNAMAALQQLLLVLPALRHADVAVRRFWSNVHRERRAPMNKLFVEMLEACLR
ncbi:Estrogen-related receptor gamma [Eumeta japonica]|uniref:Estrogen-related receptor gamma n=1 Tax=Eumeta variegata TaxID=151549 RepID=A0A4C1WKS1_EUMVA|nr:Estrogen-related receptor gamma [Eumeta japonica]